MSSTGVGWSEAEARNRMVEWEKSGLSPKEFAARFGISVRRLMYWLGRLQPTENVPRTGASVASVASPRFVELVVRPPMPAVAEATEVCFPTGHVVRFPAGVGIPELLRAVASLAC